MDGLTLILEAEAAGLTVRADGDRLVVRGPRRSEPIAKRVLAHKVDVLAFLRASPPNADVQIPATLHHHEMTTTPVPVMATRDRQELISARFLQRCKHCGRSIAWGEVVEICDSASPQGRKPKRGEQRWIKLDRDYMPHACRAQ